MGFIIIVEVICFGKNQKHKVGKVYGASYSVSFHQLCSKISCFEFMISNITHLVLLKSCNMISNISHLRKKIVASSLLLEYISKLYV